MTALCCCCRLPSSCQDPRLSPYFCNEHILRRFPPTFLAAGGFDPLLDDTIDFDVRLEKAGASR
mgnify:CR=1 FL=1